MEEAETTLGSCVDCQEQGPSRYLCSSDLSSPNTQGTRTFPQPLFGVPETFSLPSRQCQGEVKGRKTLQRAAASPTHLSPPALQPKPAAPALRIPAPEPAGAQCVA